MANKAIIDRLKVQNDRIIKHDKDALISRSKWGEITFEDARSDFERIYWLAHQIPTFPVEVLPDQVLNQFVSQIETVANHLDQIDQFNIQSGNPSGTRNSLASQLHSHTDNLYINCAPWIPFLAHQKGDVARNIENLTQSVRDADKIVAEAKTTIAARTDEIEKIIQAAREASAGAGAAVFTQDFENAANAQDKAAGTWLIITAGAVLVTLGTAFSMWAFTEPGLDQGQLVQKLSTKLFILALLITATVWCGRNYKALRHLATINRHRSLSIRTLQAFAHAATDPQTKDAVLMEATRAVFGNVPTGFIDGGGSDGDLKIVEIARSVIPRGSQS
jgi:hypothetical protein